MMNQVVKWVGLFLIFNTFVACATVSRSKKPPVQASKAATQIYAKAEQAKAAKQETTALKHIQSLIQNHPNSSLVDDAHYLRGNIYFEQRQFAKAYEAYQDIYNSEFESPLEAQAILMSGRSLQQIGKYDEALAVLENLNDIEKVPDEIAESVLLLKLQLFQEMRKNLESVETLLRLHALNNKNKNQYYLQAIDYVQGRISERELKVVANSSHFGFLRTYGQFEFAKLLYEQGQISDARSLFQDVVASTTAAELVEKAQAYLDEIESRNRVSPNTIGVVLPLSGRHANIGQRTLRGIQLGLGLVGPNKSNLRLAIVDSEGNPNIAKRGVSQLVTEDHAIALIGSVLSRTATKVAEKSHELGVPSIGLSQKSGLTQIGHTVFRNALTSEMQIRELVRIAMQEQKARRFAILYPNDAYGVEYANLFWDEVLARGGEIRGAQLYKANESDFSEVIQRLVGTFYVEDRSSEYEFHLRNWKQKQTNTRKQKEIPNDLLPPLVDFDAIFIADAPQALIQIVPTLKYNDVKSMHLIGTNLWNSETLLRRGQTPIDNAIFVDTLLATDKNFTKSAFYQSFESTFGEKPGVFELQGYDAALILRQILASGVSSRDELTSRLASINSFPGAIGNLSMSTKREILRPLVPLTFFNNSIIPLSELPRPKAN